MRSSRSFLANARNSPKQKVALRMPPPDRASPQREFMPLGRLRPGERGAPPGYQFSDLGHVNSLCVCRPAGRS